jgi:hypothetical protein
MITRRREAGISIKGRYVFLCSGRAAALGQQTTPFATIRSLCQVSDGAYGVCEYLVLNVREDLCFVLGFKHVFSRN